MEESHLDKVADPAAGAGGIEALTDELIAHAWTLFQEIEAAGGLAAALESGLIQQKVGATRGEHAKAVARRKEPITGVSEFPLIAEAEVAVLDAASRWRCRPRRSRSTFDAAAGRPAGRAVRGAARRLRPCAGQNRHAAEAVSGQSRPDRGVHRPRHLRQELLRGRRHRDHLQRRLRDGRRRQTDLAALVAAFKASGAPVACLCSSDALYAEEAAAAATALKAAGAKHLWLAGKLGAGAGGAGEGRPASAASSSLGADVLAVLREAHKAIGV